MVLGASACTDETPTEPSESTTMARATATSYFAVDLGTLNGGNFSVATAINPTGKVVGWSSLVGGRADGQLHAFLWEDGVMTDLGTLGGSQAEALPSILEGRWWVRFSSWAAPLFGIEGTWLYLETLGGSFSSAEGINPAGQVVGRSQTATREAHATLWTRK